MFPHTLLLSALVLPVMHTFPALVLFVMHTLPALVLPVMHTSFPHTLSQHREAYLSLQAPWHAFHPASTLGELPLQRCLPVPGR